MEHVTTPSEVEAAIGRQDNPVLVQFGKRDCPQCAPLTDSIEALKVDFAFEHLMVTVTDAQSWWSTLKCTDCRRLWC
jgi:glutaredoxin-related protein